MSATGGNLDLDGRARSRVGSTVREKYFLERLLGVGGMAAVYVATHRNGHRVALKMLHPELSVDPDLRGRFLREGYVANKVEHAGAVRILDDHEADDSVFLVMDLLEGEALDARWHRAGRQLPIREVSVVAFRLLDVLAAAHAKGIVHRDIKPENLFVTIEGELKVLDFGIARLAEPDGTSKTRTGRTMGTPAYMPPEQARGRKMEIDWRTDLWAVGATMFTLLSGEYVHQGAETTEEMIILTATRRVRPLREAAPFVPDAIAAVVDRALAYQKADRWPSADAMRDALDAAFTGLYGQSLRGATLPTAPRAFLPLGGTLPSAKPGAVDPQQGIETRPAGRVASPAIVPSSGSSLEPTLPALPKASTVSGVARERTHGSVARPATLIGAVVLLLLVAVAFGLVLRGRSTTPAADARAAVTPISIPADEVVPPPPLDAPPVASAPPTGTAALPPPPSALPPVAHAPAAAHAPPSAHAPPPVAPAASKDCPLESYVEIVKGEPVTHYRRACR
ncbi:MAG TPA: serine/threonine-protein kinase [Polyangiaceae bacterium]|jgi:serine/threonine-protein kinase